MTRPDLAKLGYLIAFVGVLAACVGLAWWAVGAGLPWLAWLLVVALLVPGRLQAVLLRDHFRGRRAHQAGRHDEARQAYEAQAKSIEARPWLNAAVWLSWMVYTVRADAMVWNNRAALALDDGRPDDAEAAARAALRLDPLYPLPWVNLAAVAARADDGAEVVRCVAEARRLGFRGGLTDRQILSVSAAYARVQGL